MSKERICGWLTVIMTGAFFVALLWGYGQYQQGKRAMVLLENEYQLAYYNYVAETREMALAAAKAQGANALQQASQLSRLHTLAPSAAGHMSRLPVRQEQYQASVAYLNQVGAYAGTLAQRLTRGEALHEDEVRSLARIGAQLDDISEQMNAMEKQVAEGVVVFAQGEGSWWQGVRTALAGSQAAQGKLAAAEEKTADAYFSRLDAVIREAEPLVYQGKYSSSAEDKVAWGLWGQEAVSPEEAVSLAGEFLALTGEEDFSFLSREEINKGSIPVYNLRFKDAAEQNVYVAVSSSGGKIISYGSEAPLGAARLKAAEAEQKAAVFLRRAGYENMRLVKQERIGDALLLVYVPFLEDVLYYPDKLTVKVALEEGSIAAFDASDYWLNKRSRLWPEEYPVLAGERAVICNEAGEEIFCYELRHEVNGHEYFTYIGADSLLEEKILCGYTAKDGSFYTR